MGMTGAMSTGTAIRPIPRAVREIHIRKSQNLRNCFVHPAGELGGGGGTLNLAYSESTSRAPMPRRNLPLWVKRPRQLPSAISFSLDTCAPPHEACQSFANEGRLQSGPRTTRLQGCGMHARSGCCSSRQLRR